MSDVFECMDAGEDGWTEWVHPLPGYQMKCCDCGLVHDFQFAIVPRNEQVRGLNEGESDEAVITFRARRGDQPGKPEVMLVSNAAAEDDVFRIEGSIYEGFEAAIANNAGTVAHVSRFGDAVLIVAALSAQSNTLRRAPVADAGRPSPCPLPQAGEGE